MSSPSRLGLDPGHVGRRARAHGLSGQEADALVQLAVPKLGEAMAQSRAGEPVAALRLVEAIRQNAADEAERERLFDAACERELGGHDAAEATDGPASKRLRLDHDHDHDHDHEDDGLDDFFGPDDGPCAAPPRGGPDLVTAMCRHVELAVELAKHLGPEDLVRLYSVSRAFHDALDGHLLSSMRHVIAYRAPEAGRVFHFKLYRRLLVPDPAGRTWEQQLGPRAPPGRRGQSNRDVCSVPGLRYLQLVLVRDRCCRDVLAALARHGHRTPPGMHRTLLRLWLLMDVSTSHQRRALLRNPRLWTDVDLYNAQLFVVKLGMHFNDPVYGPLTFDMPSLVLGQRGLFFLWQVPTRARFTTPDELLEAKVRYDFDLAPGPPAAPAAPAAADPAGLGVHGVYGVPLDEVGVGHIEGWGRGRRHLMRPDELVPYEVVVRGLELDEHLVHMMVWGYFDWRTGENLVPIEHEMYISDEERVLAHADTTHADTTHLWQKKHALKKRWPTFAPDQRHRIRADDADDGLRALAWAADHPAARADEAAPALGYEIDRGFILPARRPAGPHRLRPPSAAAPRAAWAAFGAQVLMTVPREIDGDELLCAEALHNYRAPGDDAAADWDWEAWLRQEGRVRAAAAPSDGDDGEQRHADTWTEAHLQSYVEDFFDHVMVDDEDRPGEF